MMLSPAGTPEQAGPLDHCHHSFCYRALYELITACDSGGHRVLVRSLTWHVALNTRPIYLYFSPLTVSL